MKDLSNKKDVINIVLSNRPEDIAGTYTRSQLSQMYETLYKFSPRSSMSKRDIAWGMKKHIDGLNRAAAMFKQRPFIYLDAGVEKFISYLKQYDDRTIASMVSVDILKVMYERMFPMRKVPWNAIVIIRDIRGKLNIQVGEK